MRRMWYLTKPTDALLAEILREQKSLEYTYKELEGTKLESAPKGYVLDHNRVELGEGDEVFEAAREALKSWHQFPPSWTNIYPVDAPLSAGVNICMTARVFGVWWVNACRVVYVVDDAEPKRYGFAYGTLPGHVEMGEERFLVEMDAAGKVVFDIRAISQPRYWLVKLFKPLARMMQRKFATDAKAAMVEATRRVLAGRKPVAV